MKMHIYTVVDGRMCMAVDNNGFGKWQVNFCG